MHTLTLTHEQLDELYYAAGLLYMDYDEDQPADYNEYIRRYNNHIDELRQLLKESLKEKDEPHKDAHKTYADGVKDTYNDVLHMIYADGYDADAIAKALENPKEA